ncbi:MAG: hypothetical protein WBX08_04585 [Candidatus Sulfotelmatobacter sp.]
MVETARLALLLAQINSMNGINPNTEYGFWKLFATLIPGVWNSRA